MKYTNTKQITIQYNRKKGQLERWYNNQLSMFDRGLNVRKIAKPKQTTEKKRQACMTLLQENRRMEEAITSGSVVIQCCSCDRMGHWKDMQGGHDYTRANRAVCINQMNVNPQCSFCNNPATKPKDAHERIKEYLLERYSPQEYNQFVYLAENKSIQKRQRDYDLEYRKLDDENMRMKEFLSQT